jgi:hypothetical protein
MAAVIGRLSPPSVRARAFLVVALYAILGWTYVAANSLTHPETLHLHLTHFAPWPREGTFGLACFVLSAMCFFVAQLIMDTDR